MLYQLSYGPLVPRPSWPGAESNCRHHDFQSCALPTELPGPDKKPVRATGGADGIYRRRTGSTGSSLPSAFADSTYPIPSRAAASSPVSLSSEHPKHGKRRPAAALLDHSGGGIRTRDLRVMSPTSYQAAPPRIGRQGSYTARGGEVNPEFCPGGRALRAGRHPQTTATFTVWMGGRASKRHSHSSPPSRPIQSCPVVVPK